jgi:hypothetical protein
MNIWGSFGFYWTWLFWLVIGVLEDEGVISVVALSYQVKKYGALRPGSILDTVSTPVIFTS